jgi:hypothetical protein
MYVHVPSFKFLTAGTHMSVWDIIPCTPTINLAPCIRDRREISPWKTNSTYAILRSTVKYSDNTHLFPSERLGTAQINYSYHLTQQCSLLGGSLNPSHIGLGLVESQTVCSLLRCTYCCLLKTTICAFWEVLHILLSFKNHNMCLLVLAPTICAF